MARSHNPFEGRHRACVVAAMPQDCARRGDALGVPSEDAAVNGCNYRGGAVMNAEFLVDVVEVPLHGSPGDVEPLCYLVIFEAFDRKLENCEFAAGKRGNEPRPRG